MRKLILDDFLEDIDYALIGIHCSIEDFRLAYLLNQNLNLKLKRKVLDIEFEDTSSYSIFEWQDNSQLTNWNLVSNTSKIEISDTKDSNSLFINHESFTKTQHLIPEYSKVNFILKIGENPKPNIAKRILNKILNIPQVITAYSIDPKNLKMTDQLIFN